MVAASELQFSQVPGFSRLFLDYVSGVPELETLYDFRPDQKGYEYAIRQGQASGINRQSLADVITQQYHSHAGLLPKNLIEKLRLPQSCTVTTGHQLCLAGGPAYFVYKIASVIQLAEKLSKMYSANVVPVYWMASEDHDIAEVSTVSMFGKKATWNTNQRGAVGRLNTNDLASFIEEVSGFLGASPQALEMSATLKRIYAPGKTIAAATREFVHWLFGDKVICIDPDDAELKKQVTGIFVDDLTNHTAEKLVLQTNAFLSGKMYETQVNPRTINLFRLDGVSRSRIDESTDELVEEVKNHPENFSPNVVLRPVYQQILLPNVAYVGGPGELVYWLQYKRMFEHYRVPFPVLQPRFFALQIAQKDFEWMHKNRISILDLIGDFDESLKRKLADRAGEELSLENEQEILNLMRSTVADKASRADATLRAFAEAEMKKAGDALKVVEVRMMRAIKQREEVFTTQFRKLRDKILPDNILQERSENFLSLSIATGISVQDILNSDLFPVSGVKVLTQPKE
jgi:bacillithiol biosynthesis cysteine-adding enzyme BshC